MTLLTFYNSSMQALYAGNYTAAATSLYETAFYGSWPYLMILGVVLALVYMKSRNLGVLGVIGGLVSSVLIQWGKFPVEFYLIPIVIIAVSFGLSVFLFYTDRDSR